MNLASKARDIPWWKTVHREGHNPFDSIGLDWCIRCKMAVDTDTEAHYQEGVYAYRRRCLRCGHWTNYGLYKVPLISDKPLPAMVFEWIKEPGKDKS